MKALCDSKGLAMYNYRSDIYVPCTPDTLALVETYNRENRRSNGYDIKFTRFQNLIHGCPWMVWMDIPFQYAPYWEAKQRQTV